MMTEKMSKIGSTAHIQIGCGGCFVTFMFVGLLIGSLMDDIPLRGYLMFGVLVLSFVVWGLIANYLEPIFNKKSKEEDEKVKNYILAKIKDFKNDDDSDIPIILMSRASYFGGHKKYSEQADVTVVLTKHFLAIKELPGHPETRIDIYYSDISDFGIESSEKLTVSRFLLVGILAFALKKKERYLYIKYLDKMGFENNPVLGEFIGKSISDFNSQLYKLIEKSKKNNNGLK